jgi:diguanylate cyclase (GGDEF)-like protein
LRALAESVCSALLLETLNLITPIRLSPSEANLRDDLNDALVEELYARSKPAVAVLLPTLLLIWSILGNLTNEISALPWIFIGLGVALVGRLAAYIVISERAFSSSFRHGIMSFGTLLVGAGLGAIIWISFQFLDPVQVGLLTATLAGINSIAVISLSCSPFTYMLYMIPSMGCLTWMAFRHPVPTHGVALQILLCIYIASLVVMVLQVHSFQHKSIRLNLSLSALALRDSLTGLRNRRFLAEFMGPEVDQVLRSWGSGARGKSLALIVIDLDHFKKINDAHGHAVGDSVLRRLSEILEDTVRKPDFVIRWGGEEFVVVARNIERDAAAQLAARLRARVEAEAFPLSSGEPLRCTCSVGFALLPFHPASPAMLSWDQVFIIADEALYAAKRDGRNRAYGFEAGETPWPAPQEVMARIESDLTAAARADLIRHIRA